MLPSGSQSDSGQNDTDTNGLVHIKASEYFPKKLCVPDDPNITLPFQILSGEYLEHVGKTAEGIIALTNYRLFVQYPQSYVNLPVRMIEQADMQAYNNSITFTCKNATTVRVSFLTSEKALDWQKRILSAINTPKKLEDLFAFTFYAWKSEERSTDKNSRCFNTLSAGGFAFDLLREVKRMRFDPELWRISEINVKYEISPTYPKFHIVPKCIADNDLSRIADFRSSRRFPSIVWRNRRNGAVIARSSQPELGFFGWRCAQDENLLQAITTSCYSDHPENAVSSAENGENGHVLTNGDATNAAMPKLLILDARSYAAAVANRAKGGGSEYAEYYPNCEIQYMSMANIHTVRKSFYQLRQLTSSQPDRIDFLTTLDKTLWLHHVSAIIKTTWLVISAVDTEMRPVLVHCSDGWDRTTQIVALAMLMLDSHYRTIKGFQTLIEWQWLEFGHKFADRCGHGSVNDETERCPIFLQWLDCVYQLICQFPIDFEFNEAYLIHLAHHVYSCLFGTFLCNNPREREKNSVNDRTFSLWTFLQQEADEVFSNLLYTKRDMVLRPEFNVRSLNFWSNLYVTEFNPLSANVHPAELGTVAEVKPSNSTLNRTRSVENLPSSLTNPPSSAADSHALHRASSASNLSLNIESHIDEPQPAPLPVIPLENAVSSSPVMRTLSLHKSPSLPLESESGIRMSNLRLNDTEDVEEKAQLFTQSAPNIHLKEAVIDPKNLMERSTDTIVHEDGIQTLLLERYPSNNDVSGEMRPEIEEEFSEGPSSCLINPSPSSLLSQEALPIPGKASWSNGPQNISESLMASAMFSFAESHHTPKIESVMEKSESKTLMNLSVTPTPLVKFDEAANGMKERHSPSRPRRTSRHLTSASSSDSFHSDGNDLFPDVAVVRRQLGPDGLAVLHDEKQMRMRTIRHAYEQELGSLRRELASIKSSLKMHNAMGSNGMTPNGRCDSTSEDIAAEQNGHREGDCVDYATSYGSDVSWENIDDREAQSSQWSPSASAASGQSVSKCNGCESRFWLGKRKHHCRRCGKYFCSNCSDYQIPLPQERLYSPVRVCRSCYMECYKQNNGAGLRSLVNRPRHGPPTQPTHA